MHGTATLLCESQADENGVREREREREREGSAGKALPLFSGLRLLCSYPFGIGGPSEGTDTGRGDEVEGDEPAGEERRAGDQRAQWYRRRLRSHGCWLASGESLSLYEAFSQTVEVEVFFFLFIFFTLTNFLINFSVVKWLKIKIKNY